MFLTQCSFLGHGVSEAGISCDEKKMNLFKIGQFQQTFQRSKSFLGLLGYHRRFVHNFSTIAFPLTELTRKAKSFIWTDSCQVAFEKLKQCLVSSPILAYQLKMMISFCTQTLVSMESELFYHKFSTERKRSLLMLVISKKNLNKDTVPHIGNC